MISFFLFTFPFKQQCIHSCIVSLFLYSNVLQTANKLLKCIMEFVSIAIHHQFFGSHILFCLFDFHYAALRSYMVLIEVYLHRQIGGKKLRFPVANLKIFCYKFYSCYHLSLLITKVAKWWVVFSSMAYFYSVYMNANFNM